MLLWAWKKLQLQHVMKIFLHEAATVKKQSFKFVLFYNQIKYIGDQF